MNRAPFETHEVNVAYSAINKEGPINGTASKEASLRLWSTKSGEPKGTPVNHARKFKLRRQVDEYVMFKW